MACLDFINEYKRPFIKPDDMPRGLITLNTFKMESLERISVLNFLEKVSDQHSPQSASWIKAILKEFSSKYPKYFILCTEMHSSFKVLKARHYDRVTYFVLAHAVVNRKSHDLTNWFVRNEIRLFSIQFLGLSVERQREFILEHNLSCEPVEKDFIANTEIKEVYKVPWTYVLRLIKHRGVSLKNGKAYIDGSHLHLVAAAHQTQLLKSFLSSVRISLPTATLDDRFRELIEDLGKQCQKIVDNPLWCLDLEENETELDSLSNLSHSFPPCMHRIHHHMDQTKHLRHYARMQYIPFLMEIGLSVNDTMTYFRNTFMQIMSEKAYKQGKYDYTIMYQFGLVGRKVRQRCSDCKLLQRTNVNAVGDCHGCPLTSHEGVRRILSLPTYGDISEKGKQEILSLCYSDQPSKICAAIFGAKHDVRNSDSNILKLPQFIVNPVQYYALSRLQERDDEEDSD